MAIENKSLHYHYLERMSDKKYDAGRTTSEVAPPPPCSYVELSKALLLMQGSYVVGIGVESGGK